MTDGLFKPKSTAIKHLLSQAFSTSVRVTDLVDYMKTNKDIENMKQDLEGMKNISKYIKSILG